MTFRNERASKIQISVSAFPFEKTLKDFDFDFQPSLNKTQILDFESLRFLENKENILFFGYSGVGKSHLAVAIGVAAAKKRNMVYFISCHDLIMQLYYFSDHRSTQLYIFIDHRSIHNTIELYIKKEHQLKSQHSL